VYKALEETAGAAVDPCPLYMSYVEPYMGEILAVQCTEQRSKYLFKECTLDIMD
jgi:hypothetical protein